MYLSCLLIDVGDDPDRPRPGRLWLRNLYRVHQRLCMAFPSAATISEDADFLRPFKRQGFGEVHVPRATDAGFLFRIDPQPGGRVVILVQSAASANWDYAFHNASYLLAAPPQVKSFVPCFAKEQRLRFCLVANATRRIDTKSGPDGRRRHGKRVPVKADQLGEWLAGRAEAAGFSIDKDLLTVQPGYIYVNDPERQEPEAPSSQKGRGYRLFSVRYDGVLTITDSARFQGTLVRGIGPGKAFGLGLLSVAPAAVPASAP
jgi:CRISPR system Cascade subunit CasE